MAAVTAACALLAGCTAGSGTATEPTRGAATARGDATASPTAPAPATPPASPTTGYEVYVALGDSLAAGYQPTNPGDRTDPDGGYAGLVRAGLPQPSPPDLVNLGCPGETTTTMAEGGRCPYPEGSQVRAAEELLAKLPGDGERALVSVQIGANDVQRCVVLRGDAPRVDEECVAQGLDSVREQLPDILRRVSSAAPAATLVAVDYYNPFVVAALLGPPSQAFARRTEEVQDELNEIVADAASEVGASLATIAPAFTSVPRGATAATPAVGPVCSVTWMCAEPPDIHPTDRGYRLIADQVVQAATASR